MPVVLLYMNGVKRNFDLFLRFGPSEGQVKGSGLQKPSKTTVGRSMNITGHLSVHAAVSFVVNPFMPKAAENIPHILVIIFLII